MWEPAPPRRCNRSVEEDVDLLTRAQAGDSAAFGVLAERHQPAAFHLACVIVGNASEAEDVTQDALLKAYVALPRFTPQAPFRPWLLQIVANESRNRRRSAGRRAHLLSRVAATDEWLVEPSPELAVLADEQRRALLTEVSGLRDEDRMAIAGRYFLDLSEAEIADLLGCARGTVKSRLSRSLVRLRARLTAREAVALLIALVLLGLLTWQPSRDAIADRLGLRGVDIVHVPEVTTPQPLMVPAALGLGAPIDAATAAARLGQPVLRPYVLGAPDAMYGQPGEVWLAYAPRPGLPPAPEMPGLGLLLTEFGRTGFDPVFLTKGLPPNTNVQELRVAGQRGVWINGAPHVFFREANGNVRDRPPLLAGNTLLWEQFGRTLRIESALDREPSVRIAESLGTD